MAAAPPARKPEGKNTMRVIIAGCGRVGSTLATQLVAEGHDVRLVDRLPRTRRLLPAGFPGRFHEGNAYSRTVLEAAGIEHADAFVAVTSGDNSNIVSARTAKETYRVPIVLARIYDPRRADIYRELGIPTIASVRWTVHQIHQMLLHRHLTPELAFGNGETLLIRSQLPEYLTGRRLTEFDVDGEIRVVEVTRAGRSLLPAKRQFAVPRAAARVNDAENAWPFDQNWGVDTAVPAATPLISLIEEATGATDTVALLRLSKAGVDVIETAITPQSRAAGRTLAEITLPTGTVIATVIRDGEPTSPMAELRLQPGDELLVVSHAATEQEIHAVFQ